MGLQIQPGDVVGALNGIGAIQNPSGTVLAFFGFSEEEQKAGVPGWAWGTALIAAGVYVEVKFAPQLKGRK